MSSYHLSRVLSNDLIGESVRHLVISTPEPIPYQAGQFFLMRLRDTEGNYVERSYSVANFDENGELRFVIRIDSKGHMSQLINALIPGDPVDIKGPFGHFGYQSLPELPQKLVLIAGGVGISPFYSMAQHSFLKQESFPIQLFYGFRRPDDYLFRTELEGFAEAPRLQIFPAISEEGEYPDWNGKRGYIGDCLDGDIFPPEPGTHCYICGPPVMVKATRDKLFELGFDRHHIHVEAW
ncbi:MAG: FAD-dependent oxidoreductase [bacterium]|nr:FAD-dependent oxidoreductase [bacterium]